MIFVFPTVLYYYNRPSLFCQPLLQKFCPPFFAGRGLSSAKALSFRDFATHGCLHTRENSPPVCRLQSRLKNAEPRKIASLPRLFCEKPLQYPCRYAILYASFARIIRAKHGGVLKWPKRSVLKNSHYCLCKIVKTLDLIGVFVGSSAHCEKRFSQFSRKFLAVFSQFPNVFEPILNWFGDYLGQFNILRRDIEVVITRRS